MQKSQFQTLKKVRTFLLVPHTQEAIHFPCEFLSNSKLESEKMKQKGEKGDRDKDIGTFAAYAVLHPVNPNLI